MDSSNNLPVPLMRECVSRGGSGNQVSLGAALAAIVVFVAATILGFGMSLLLASKAAFLFVLVGGLVASVATYHIGSRIARALPGPQQTDKVLLVYQPLLGKLNSAGFEAASEHAKAIVRLGLALAKAQPHVFSVIDESLRFFLGRFLTIVQARDLIGDSSDLRRQIARLQSSLDEHLANARQGRAASPSDRAALDTQIVSVQARLDRIEQVNRAALQLTTELAKLRADCENAVVEKAIGEEEARRSAALLKEQLEREKRVQAELKLLGL